jgi:hypothetical protein
LRNLRVLNGLHENWLTFAGMTIKDGLGKKWKISPAGSQALVFYRNRETNVQHGFFLLCFFLYKTEN